MDDRWNTMLELVVHPRVSARHPQLSDEDVRVAWQNSFFQALRTGSKNSPEYLWIGIDGKGRDRNGWRADGDGISHLSREHSAFKVRER